MEKTVKQIILFYSVIVLLKVLLGLFILSPSAYSDEYNYIKLARSFFFDFSFSIHGILTSVYLPLYPSLLSVSYLFKDMTIIYPMMKVINSIISSLIIIPAFLLAKEFLNDKKSLVIAVLISITSSNFLFSNYILSENLFYPLFLFTFYFIYKSLSDNGYKYNLLSGIFLGLSYLTKPLVIGIIFAFLFSYMVLFFSSKKLNRELIIKKFLLSLFLFLIVISPWIIRNINLYGFHLKLFFGGYTNEAVSIVTDFNVINYIVKFFVYLSYLVLASLIIFPLKMINIFNKKYFTFLILFIPLLISTLLIVANHGRVVIFFEWFTGRYIGRYVDFLLPLIFIGGFIGADEIKKNNKFINYLFFFLVVISSLLTLHVLFPINNLLLTWVGVLKYVFEFVFYNKTNYSVEFLSGSLFFFIILFMFLFFLIIFLEKRFGFKKLIPFIFIFFILLNVLNYGIIYYDSKTNWYDQEQMQLGLWLNKYDSDKISKILIDKNSYGVLNKDLQEGIWGGSENTPRTIIGYWLNDNIIIEDLSHIQDYDYVITKSKLNLYLIKEGINGIYIYQVKK